MLIVVAAALVGGSRAFTTGQSANLVLGQENFTNGSKTLNSSGFSGEASMAFDSPGNLWVADTANNRALGFQKGGGFTPNEPASVVAGQIDFTVAQSGFGPGRLSQPSGVALDSAGNLWVSDSANNRVVEYTAPLASNQSATLVLGQPNFNSNSPATTATGLSNPAGLAFDSSGNLWVVDQGNNRILQYSPPFTSGEAASLVIGQPDFTHGLAVTSATGLRIPAGIAFDSQGDLWVADQYDSRILEFTSPFSTGETASLVLGQSSFTTLDGGVGPSALRLPAGVGFDSNGTLWVADTGNNRVVAFYRPFSTGEAASVVVGQPDLSSSAPATTVSGLRGPLDVAFDPSGNMWVADSGNNRILEFLGPSQTSTTSTSSTPTTSTVTTTATSTSTSTATTTTTATATTTATVTTTATISTTRTLTTTVTSTTGVSTTTTFSATSTAVTTISTTLTTTATSTSAVTATSTSTVTTTTSQTITSTSTSTSTSTTTQTVQTTQTTTQTTGVTSTSTTTSTATATSTTTATVTQTVDTTETATKTTGVTSTYATTSTSTSTLFTTIGKCTGPGCSNTSLLAVAIAGVGTAVILFILLLMRWRPARRATTIQKPQTWR